jgi:hypothetical protein
MEAVLVRRRKRFVNFDFLNDIVEEADSIIHGIEKKVNDTLNDILDDCFIGKTETVNYEDISSVYACAFTGAKNKNKQWSCKKEVHKNNYRRKLEEICSECKSKKINDVAEMLAGKYVYAYSIKEKTPRRMWKWTDRLSCIEEELRNCSPSINDSKYLLEMKSALESNNYLRRKHKDIYEKLISYF